MNKKIEKYNNKNNTINDIDKILKDLVKDIEKSFGKGSAMILDDNSKFEFNIVSTGSFLLNEAIGIGGYPKGRIVEIFGPESSGKTTFALHAIAEIQKNNGRAAFIDAEHSLNPDYAKKIGVDVKKLIISQPDYGEQALDILEILIKSNEIDLIVIDSVSALVPKKELEGEIEDQNIGNQARMMSKALRRLNGIIAKNNCLVIFINQLREKVGVVFGNPETTSGGRALRFYSSLRIDIRKIESLKNSIGDVTGCNVKAKIVKNKLAPPFKIAITSINFDSGIDKYNEMLILSVSQNLISRSGTWYSYKEQKIGQGKKQTIKFFKDNPKIFNEIKNKILENFKNKN